MLRNAHRRNHRRRHLAARPAAEFLEDRCLLSGSQAALAGDSLDGAVPPTEVVPADPPAAIANEVPGRYIVTLRPGVDPQEVVADHRGRGHRIDVEHVYGHALNGFAFRGEALADDPRVLTIEPDLHVQTYGQTLPTGVNRIEAELNATANIDGTDDRVDVDVAVIDTGIDLDHPDLDVYRAVDVTSAGTGGDDDDGHGTHVAGTIAALDNGGGVVGVAPGARLWGVKVLGPNGGYLSDVIQGVDYVTQHASEIEVANVSLGWQGLSSTARSAIQNSVAAGVVYVVAAGNAADDVYGADGTFGTSDDYGPASYPEVMTISAMADSDGQSGGTGGSTSYGSDDSFASFSNYSTNVVAGNPVDSSGAAIDLILPGVSILSTYAGGGYAYASGTSMAAPHAAGLAALFVAGNFDPDGTGTRDYNGDGLVDEHDVSFVRQALNDAGVAQTDADGLAKSNDPDGKLERLGWAEWAAATNAAPVAGDDAYSVSEDGTLTAAAPGVLGNDSDADGDPLSASLVSGSGPAHGTLTFNADGSFSYAPDADFNGSDAFQYRVDDGNGGSDTATVSIAVDPVNDAPVAHDDATSTSEDTAVTVDVLANDDDVDGDALTVTDLVQPTNGAVTLNSNQTVTYTPNAGFVGEDAFTYTAHDGTAESAPATVTITVLESNTPPSAADDAASTSEDSAVTIDVLANDGDADGDPLTVAKLVQPTHGTVVLNADQTATYTPDADFHGTDSFQYTVDDGKGGTDTATVSITVDPVNDAPTAVDDSYAVEAGNTLTVSDPGVLRNDDDVDGDALTASLVDVPANGTLTLGDDGSFAYTPDDGFSGEDVFRYEVADGNGGTDTASVTLTVASAGMHVDDLAGSTTDSKNTWAAIVTVTIRDASGNPVAGATVTGSWSEGASGTVSGQTDAQGRWTVTSDFVHKKNSSITFTVDGVSHPDLNYDAAGNAETSITVGKDGSVTTSSATLDALAGTESTGGATEPPDLLPTVPVDRGLPPDASARAGDVLDGLARRLPSVAADRLRELLPTDEPEVVPDVDADALLDHVGGVLAKASENVPPVADLDAVFDRLGDLLDANLPRVGDSVR